MCEFYSDKLKIVAVDLYNLSNITGSDVAKKTVYDELLKKLNNIQTIYDSNLVKKSWLWPKFDENQKKIPNHDIYLTTQKLC